MDTYAFVQGMLTILAIAGVIGIVWALNEIRFLKRSLNTYKNHLNDLEFKLQVRIDREVGDLSLQSIENKHEVDSRFEEVFREITTTSEDIYRALDSRLDKFENKINSKQVLKG